MVTPQDSLIAAVPDSEARYRSLFDHLDSGFCIIEVLFDADHVCRDYRFVEANPAFARHTGLKDAIGRRMRELAPTHEQRWFDMYGRIAQTGVPARFEAPAEALGNRWFDVHAFRIGGPQTHQVALLLSDITERRLTAAALEELNTSLERQVSQRTQERDRVWQVSQDMLGVATSDGIWRSVNPAWHRTLGWNEDEIVGRSADWLEHPDDRDRTQAAIASLKQGNTSHSFESRLRSRSGQYRLLSWRATPDRGLIYAVARDITLERERELALRDAEEFTRLALSAVGGVGVWTYQVSSDRFFCDAAISALYGLDPQEGAAGIARVRFLANVHPDDMPKLRETMEGGLHHGKDIELEYRIRHPDGGVRWVLSRGRTFLDGDGRPLRRTGIGVELTKQRQLEEQFRQSQKMESLGQLTGGIAHDFNNLLQGIVGSVGVARKLLSKGRLNEIDRYLEVANRSTQRAAALTHRLLAFARRQPLDPHPLDVNQLVAGTEELLRRTLGEHIDLTLKLHDGLWPVRCDGNQLETALLNLVINARDAMPDGGALTVETSNAHTDPGQALTNAEAVSAEYVCVAVSDTGTGMSAATIERAFDPFFTTKPLGQGTGLGLSMIHGFAHQSGGHARIVSEVGRGTSVRICIPRYLGEVSAPSVQPFAEVIRPSATYSILVVEDEPVVRQLIVELLEAQGYRCVQAADGGEAARLLRTTLTIDLLITDVGLPVLNGRQVADIARELRPAIKILFMTGYAENAALPGDLLEAGMALITKPFPLDTLSQRVGHLLVGTGA
jgi:PAS domain S-box-containing protein